MKKYFYLVAVALTAAFTLTACSDDDDAAENARPAEGTTAYFDAMRDSIYGEYIDAFEMYDKMYFSIFKFMEDGQALSILYSKRPSCDTIEVDSTEMTWKIDEELLAKTDSNSYYALYRSTPMINLGLTQELVDELVAEGHSEIYTDTMVVVVDAKGHIDLLEKHSDAEEDAETETRSWYDPLVNAYKKVKKVTEDAIKTAKAELSKISLTSGIIATGSTYSHWMANIDDSAPLRCVSIPGTHDTFTYGISYVFYTYGCTQWATLEEQFNYGIRCFDLRLDYYKKKEGDEKLQLTHNGLVDCHITFEEALEKIKDCLQAHTSETAIVVVKIDNSDIKGQDREDAVNLIDQTLQKWAQKGYVAPWNPNMTMKDARNNLVVIARYPTKLCIFAKACVKDKESTQDWGDNVHEQQLLARYTDDYALSAPLWVQDDYHQHDNEDKSAWISTKVNLLRENIEYLNSVDLTKEENYIWAFNQTSGYAGSNGIVMDYPCAAEILNPYMTDLLTGEYQGKFTGIVVMDYGGTNVRATGNVDIVSHETHGDKLPQAIIRNNNYLKLGDLNIAKTPIE